MRKVISGSYSEGGVMGASSKRLFVTAMALSLVALMVGTAGATPSKYTYHAGDDSPGLEPGPDVARASADGATITIRSAGAFHVSSHKASSTLGTFEHRVLLAMWLDT